MKQHPNTETTIRSITVPPETLAAIRIAEGIPQLVDLVGTALTKWGDIGTTDPVDLGDIHQVLTDAADQLPDLLQDLVLLREAMLKQDDN